MKSWQTESSEAKLQKQISKQKQKKKEPNKDSRNGQSWEYWDENFRNREDLNRLPLEVLDDAEFFRFLQWEFYEEWIDFKNYANEKGIRIVGDAPFNVLYDSADVWAHQDLFYLDSNRKPTVVAGVPPDFFSETGQLWGNPCYNWEVMLDNDFRWWKSRIKNLLKLVDTIRIDHFRGFESYWSIPAGESTAVNGQWVKTPGDELFKSLQKEFGDKLPDILIAEDLGVITDAVNDLRNKYGFAGMKIFQMASFEAIAEPGLAKKETPDSFYKYEYVPENYITNCIAYPGTHDNDVLQGWIDSQEKGRDLLIYNYLGIRKKGQLNQAVIKKLMESKANGVIFQMQDILGLGTSSRMNLPGTCGSHNWSWRILPEQLDSKTAERIFQLTKKTRRI